MNRLSKTLIAFFLLAVGLAPSARAQVAPLSTLRMVYEQQRQVDGIQDRLDGTALRYAVVSLDQPTINPVGTMQVSGWSFRCGQPSGPRLIIMVDGMPSVQAEDPLFPGLIIRSARPDVANFWNTGLCAMIGTTVPTDNAGFFSLVDLTPYQNGWYGDGWHYVEVRQFDTANVMARSQTYWIFHRTF